MCGFSFTINDHHIFLLLFVMVAISHSASFIDEELAIARFARLLHLLLRFELIAFTFNRFEVIFASQNERPS